MIIADLLANQGGIRTIGKDGKLTNCRPCFYVPYMPPRYRYAHEKYITENLDRLVCDRPLSDVDYIMETKEIIPPCFSNLFIHQRSFIQHTILDAAFVSCQIQQTDFQESNLQGCTFYGAEIANCDFSQCDLTACDFSFAYLRDCDFTEAILTGAKFEEARLINCDFTDAKIEHIYGNGGDIKSLQCSQWNVTIMEGYMAIGCKTYKQEEWWNFTDEEIDVLDTFALEWWKEWKSILRSIVDVTR